MYPRHAERGQTIVLVAMSLLALLAMMALAIDVTLLYVDRAEAQQVVDAAAGWSQGVRQLGIYVWQRHCNYSSDACDERSNIRSSGK